MIDQKKIHELLIQAGTEVVLTENDFDKPFKEIGLDSLDIFNFLGEIEESLGRPISDEDFENLNTLNDVIEFLNK